MRQLAEGHMQMLLPTVDVPVFVISKMLVYNGLEPNSDNQSQDLGKDAGTFAHND